VAPYRLDQHLRLGGSWSPSTPDHQYFRFPDDGGSFTQAATRCVGVGKCRQHQHSGGSVMCPSYQATGEEEHSTRGRARLLFEMMNGHGDSPVTAGWRSTEVRDALDLCLSCKGCKSDCPANVDMATYKAEFLAHHYEHRLRPRSHYTLGWLPVLAAAVGRGRLGTVANAITHAPALKRLLPRLAGVEPREVPLFAGETLQQWWRRRGPRGDGRRGTVLLWPDTFTNAFNPHIGQAAVAVLESAGWKVTIPTEPVCCGLTWISTGQLSIAKRVLARSIASLAPHVQAGGLVLSLEPSCTAVFRNDAHDLFPDDPNVDRLRDHTVTLAELLTQHTPGWQPPRMPGKVSALAQVHCHQHAIMGWDADKSLLDSIGVNAEPLESGCCGLAGNFGFEPGHAEVSEACAESVLLPRIRDAAPETVILADGFSCRTQIDQLDSGGRRAVHLAELLAATERHTPIGPDQRPEDGYATRPRRPSILATSTVLAAAGASGIGLAGAIAIYRRRNRP
jgi:Fe-S oxidoreductase